MLQRKCSSKSAYESILRYHHTGTGEKQPTSKAAQQEQSSTAGEIWMSVRMSGPTARMHEINDSTNANRSPLRLLGLGFGYQRLPYRSHSSTAATGQPLLHHTLGAERLLISQGGERAFHAQAVLPPLPHQMTMLQLQRKILERSGHQGRGKQSRLARWLHLSRSTRRPHCLRKGVGTPTTC